jgi:hypothetical protein
VVSLGNAVRPKTATLRQEWGSRRRRNPIKGCSLTRKPKSR